MARKNRNAGAAPLTSPQTREERYLANIAGLVATKPEYPFTRTERYLDAISSGTSGLADRVAALETGKLNVIGMGRNLFDNAYFIGDGTSGAFPINQPGLTGASAYSSEGRTVDRWFQSGACITGWENGVFTVKLSGYYSSFRQYLDESVLTEGQEYTISVLSATGLHPFTFTASKSTGAQSDAYENGLYFYVGWASDISKWAVNLATNGAQSAELVSFQPKAAKLELGPVQTLAHKVGDDWVLNDPTPNYQQELAKCQRYLQVFEGDTYAFLGITYAVSSTSIEPVLPLLVPMNKKTGSVMTSTTAYLQTNGAWNQPVTIPAGSNNVRISSNTAAFTITLTDGLLGTFPSTGAISSDGNTKIIISVE